MIHIFDLDDTLLPSNSYEKYTDIIPNYPLNNLLNEINYKYIFTNGTIGHAYDALFNMKSPVFNNIFARDNLYKDQKMKPHIDPYLFIMNSIFYNHRNAKNMNIIFYDDILCNLKTAKKLNWTTVWINTSYEDPPTFVDYKFDTIIDALIFFKYSI